VPSPEFKPRIPLKNINKNKKEPGMIAYAWRMEAGGLQVQGQSGLHSKFKGSLGYLEIPCLRKKQGLVI
jgi:hypothetical protein